MTRWFSQMLLDDHGGLFGVAVETMAECVEWSIVVCIDREWQVLS